MMQLFKKDVVLEDNPFVQSDKGIETTLKQLFDDSENIARRAASRCSLCETGGTPLPVLSEKTLFQRFLRFFKT
jgi:hypothetical protein